MEQSYGDIETFLALFPGDQVIEKKALGVVVSILKAVEDAVGYYLENIGVSLVYLPRVSSALTDADLALLFFVQSVESQQSRVVGRGL